jgi:hypothetical protein
MMLLRKATNSFIMSVCLSVFLSVCLSVHPSVWDNSAPTGRILMKFDKYFEKTRV